MQEFPYKKYPFLQEEQVESFEQAEHANGQVSQTLLLFQNFAGQLGTHDSSSNGVPLLQTRQVLKVWSHI
jgi:Mlc titration factor MtfA (ptsG expression regulator)